MLDLLAYSVLVVLLWFPVSHNHLKMFVIKNSDYMYTNFLCCSLNKIHGNQGEREWAIMDDKVGMGTVDCSDLAT